MTTMLAGPKRTLAIGQEVDGDEAERLVSAGLAVPLEEKPVKRKATKASVKETRAK